MKKILSLTGIIVLAAIVSTSAFAGSTGTGNPTNTITTMGVSSPVGQAELGVLADSNYSEYGYSRSGGNRDRYRGDRHRGGRGSWGRCGRW